MQRLNNKIFKVTLISDEEEKTIEAIASKHHSVYLAECKHTGSIPTVKDTTKIIASAKKEIEKVFHTLFELKLLTPALRKKIITIVSTMYGKRCYYGVMEDGLYLLNKYHILTKDRVKLFLEHVETWGAQHACRSFVILADSGINIPEANRLVVIDTPHHSMASFLIFLHQHHVKLNAELFECLRESSDYIDTNLNYGQHLLKEKEISCNTIKQFFITKRLQRCLVLLDNVYSYHGRRSLPSILNETNEKLITEHIQYIREINLFLDCLCSNDLLSQQNFDKLIKYAPYLHLYLDKIPKHYSLLNYNESHQKYYQKNFDQLMHLIHQNHITYAAMQCLVIYQGMRSQNSRFCRFHGDLLPLLLEYLIDMKYNHKEKKNFMHNVRYFHDKYQKTLNVNPSSPMSTNVRKRK